MLNDDSMAATVESIKQVGIANPLIVRPDPDGGYEIISDHRRHHAAELTRLDTIPVIVRELDDDAAVILMVDSNLQLVPARSLAPSRSPAGSRPRSFCVSAFVFTSFLNVGLWENKKACILAPQWGRNTRLCTNLKTQKRADTD